MTWLNPFRKHDENTRTAWDYTFQLTPEHMTYEQMHPLKFSYDVLAEECLNVLDNLPAAPDSNPEITGETKGPAPKKDLYALLRDNVDYHPKLKELWDQVNTIPDWVDWDQIARGQEVFYRYGEVSLTAVSIVLKFLFTLKSLWLFRRHRSNMYYS